MLYEIGKIGKSDIRVSDGSFLDLVLVLFVLVLQSSL